MEKEIKNLESSIVSFERLQAKHLEALKDENSLPNLQQQTLERDAAIKNLMETVKCFIKKAERRDDINSEKLLLFFSNRITTLLEQNKVIEKRVKTIRDHIKKGMTQISKGKNVINSYRSSAAASIKPRVLSITN